MKVLFVAMSDSIHAARWVSQINQHGWELHFFPSIDYGYVNPELKNVTLYHSVYVRQPEVPANVRMQGLALPMPGNRYYNFRRHLAHLGRLYLQGVNPKYRLKALVKLIRRLKPDIIHSMEFQHGAYLVSEARDILGGENFPTWIATNYGSDIYLYGRLAEHRPKIEKVLRECDFYACECERDVQIAQQMGLKGRVLPVMPNSSGFDLDLVQTLRQPGPTSQRRAIIIKGYQNFAGRALVALKAVELCADALAGYRILIYSAFPDVKISAELLAQNTGLKVELIPLASHEEILRHFGEARVYMGLSISDAISTSMLEAMVMGTFPIQSATACTDEWFIDGESGLAVPAEDPHAAAAALRRAISDDMLVDNAAALNWQTCLERLNQEQAQEQARNFYKLVLAGQS